MCAESLVAAASADSQTADAADGKGDSKQSAAATASAAAEDSAANKVRRS